MQLQIKNNTHWRTEDLKRVIRNALLAGGVEEDEKVEATIGWSGFSDARTLVHSGQSDPHLAIGLPRRGPKSPHPVPMVAIAIAASGGGDDDEAVVLPACEVFRMSNTIAYYCARGREIHEDRIAELRRASGTASVPDWTAGVCQFVVQKYKDPTKDGTYQDFVHEKEIEVARAETAIAKAQKRLDAATACLKKAQKRKATAERSLQAARARRR